MHNISRFRLWEKIKRYKNEGSTSKCSFSKSTILVFSSHRDSEILFFYFIEIYSNWQQVDMTSLVSHDISPEQTITWLLSISHIYNNYQTRLHFTLMFTSANNWRGISFKNNAGSHLILKCISVEEYFYRNHTD